jgi:hypothetical protein
MPEQYLPDRPSLTGSRLKLARAEKHLNELQPEIRAYVERQPYRVADEPDIEGEWMVYRFAEIREYPDPRWGVRAGEFFHNLRSSLDNLVWQLVLVNGKDPGDHNQFPIYTKLPRSATLKRLKKVPGATRIDDMLFGVHRDHVAAIKRLQPYLGLDVNREHRIALAALSDRNNIDKHRFVHPVVAVSEEGKGGVARHVGGPAPSKIEVVYTVGSMYEGAEVFRWRIIGGTDETKVTVEGEVPYDIAVAGHRNTTLNHLDWMRDRISEVVEHFASAFPPPGEV